MEYIVLGQTNLMVSKESFDTDSLTGSDEEKQEILKYAYNSGINFYVCNSAKTDVLDYSNNNSESTSLHMLGKAFNDKRNSVFIGVKFNSKQLPDLKKSFESSLKTLQSDYIDICILDYKDFIPLPGAEDGVFDYLITAKAEGKIKHLGLIADGVFLLEENINTQLFSVLFCPYGIKASDEKNYLLELCIKDNLGFVSLSDDKESKDSLPLLFGFLHSKEPVVSLWKMPSMEDVQKIIYFETHPPIIDEKFNDEINSLKTEG